MIAAGLFLVSFTVCIFVSNFNYKNNSILDESSYLISIDGYDSLIDRQIDTKDINYGLFKSGEKGCGWIAIYNLLVLQGNYKPAKDIIKNLDIYGTNAYGLLGTDPFGVVFYLQTQGYKVNITTNRNKFDLKAGQRGIIVGVSINGGHYQAYSKNEELGYDFFNYHKKYESMSEFIQASDYKFFILITIN